MVQWERTCARIPGLFLGNRDSSKVIDALDNAEGWTIIFQSLIYRKKKTNISLISKCSQRNPRATTSTTTTANNE